MFWQGLLRSQLCWWMKRCYQILYLLRITENQNWKGPLESILSSIFQTFIFSWGPIKKIYTLLNTEIGWKPSCSNWSGMGGGRWRVVGRATLLSSYGDPCRFSGRNPEALQRIVWSYRSVQPTVLPMRKLRHREAASVCPALQSGWEVDSRQGSLACCSPWSCKESGMTEQWNSEQQQDKYTGISVHPEVSRTPCCIQVPVGWISGIQRHIC